MSGLDFSAMNRRREAMKKKGLQSGGGNRRRGNRTGFFKPKEPGYHGLYVCPPNEGMEFLPFIVMLVHYGVGPDERQHLCLDPENPVFDMPAFKEALERRNAEIRCDHPDWVIEWDDLLADGCPTCRDIQDGDGFDEKKRKRMAQKEQCLWMVVPIYYQPLSGQKQFFPTPDLKPQVYIANGVLSNQVWDLIMKDEVDVCRFDGATPVEIKRTGRGWKDTRYSPSLARNTWEVPKPVLGRLKSLAVGEDSDPLNLIVRLFVRSPAAINGWLAEAKGEVAEVANEDVAAKPDCFADAALHDPNDATYCQKCHVLDECAGEVGATTQVEEPKPKREAAPAASATDDFMDALNSELKNQRQEN